VIVQHSVCIIRAGVGGVKDINFSADVKKNRLLKGGFFCFKVSFIDIFVVAAADDEADTLGRVSTKSGGHLCKVRPS